MTTLTQPHFHTSQESRRITVRSLINLAGEAISHFWPMSTFIHHNPLHGLEHLHIHQAIDQARQLFGGHGYLPNSRYRELYRQGGILDEALTETVRPLSSHHYVAIGGRKISHLETLRTLLIHGTGAIPGDIREAQFRMALEEPLVAEVFDRLQAISSRANTTVSLRGYADQAQQNLGSEDTLGAWCDKTWSTLIEDHIDRELIKWCGRFLDEGHAPWPMPVREKGFFGGWKVLASQDRSGLFLGIRGWEKALQDLPNQPEDAILASLRILGIPEDLWSPVFTRHLTRLPGWTGFLKWRSEQRDYEWQNAFPIDLTQYIAIRLFYERELVGVACQEHLASAGTYPTIQASLTEYPFGHGLYRAHQTEGLTEEVLQTLDRSAFFTRPLPLRTLDQWGRDLNEQWRMGQMDSLVQGQVLELCHVAKALGLGVKDLAQSTDETLGTLVDWVAQFPESRHGPPWLQAFELSYVKGYVKQFAPNLQIVHHTDAQEKAQDSSSRPLAQGIFCIDVRSEGFRRHFEEVGGNETFGFAGFFGIPICFQGFGSERETDQCPVLIHPKHRVKEIPRAYQAKTAEKFLERQSLAKTGHALLHDLKENVITPYVMVEAIGWFFGFRLFGQTMAPAWYKAVTAWIKHWFAIPIATTLTVDKLSNEEAEEMVASQHRATIYRLLIERYGRLGMMVSHDHVDRLRRQALWHLPMDDREDEALRQGLRWNGEHHEAFLAELRQTYHIHPRALAQQKHRMTQTGFTAKEQAGFVETALRIIGFTNSFARLVLVCAHGSASENNPYESALDCGACGGNEGIANARAFAAMANKPYVRQFLAQKGIEIPQDTHFLPGQHNTTTDEIEFFDLEDVPATHRNDLLRLQHDLEEAGRRNSQERLTRFPDEPQPPSLRESLPRTKRRSLDWSQVRPEWGLSRHSTFIIGRRLLTKGLNLEGRSFLHSYDYLQDPTGKYLEIIMTAPLIVGNWINMEHFFSTMDPEVYGAGSKVYHNVVGRIGVMYGTQSDLRIGLPIQTVYNGDQPYHEPMRLFAIIEAPLERISMIIARHDLLQKLTNNQWINLVALDPVTMEFFLYQSPEDWRIIL